MQWESSFDTGPRANPSISVTQAGVDGPVGETRDLDGGTLVVHASIMDGHHTPANALSVIDLALPQG